MPETLSENSDKKSQNIRLRVQQTLLKTSRQDTRKNVTAKPLIKY